MTDKTWLIKNLLMYQAELGAAAQRKYDHPSLDLITQREAFFFLRERDTAYGGKFTHGQAWVKRMTDEGKLNPQRRGKSDNSPLMYSKAEMIALWNAEYMEINEIFKGTQL